MTSKRGATGGGGPRLVICSLGPRPPHTATLETLHALGLCDVVCSQDNSPAALACLRHFSPRVRRPASAPSVLRQLRRGRIVGLVTDGAPLADPAAPALVRACRDAGIPCKVFAPVSAFDGWLAGSGLVLGHDLSGVQCYTSAAVGRGAGWSRERALVVEWTPASPAHGRRAWKALARAYGAGHPCTLLDSETGDQGQDVVLGRLTERAALGRGFSLFIPPRRGIHR